jgi:hypothetical protein
MSRPVTPIPITRCSANGEQRHKIAQDLLDFRPVRSVCGWRLTGGHHGPCRDRTSNQNRSNEIHSKLYEAARIARAAEGCALAGSVAEDVTVSIDIEQLTYEAGRLQDAASLLNRFSRE